MNKWILPVSVTIAAIILSSPFYISNEMVDIGEFMWCTDWMGHTQCIVMFPQSNDCPDSMPKYETMIKYPKGDQYVERFKHCYDSYELDGPICIGGRNMTLDEQCNRIDN